MGVVVGASLWKLTLARHAADRGRAFLIIAVFRILVNLYRLLVAPPSDHVYTPGDHAWWLPAHSEGAARMLVADAVVMAGAAINIKRWPERFADASPWASDWLDYIGNSHQLMHVLSAVGVGLVASSGWQDCQFITSSPVLAAAAANQFGWARAF